MSTSIQNPLGTILGSFSKGLPGSLTVNFSSSGGRHCSDTCTLKQSGACYAVSAEKRKPVIAVNTHRHEQHRELFCATLAAPSVVQCMVAAPWVRFSAFGSVYSGAWLTTGMRAHLSTVAAALHAKGTAYHFPVETIAKAETMRDIGFKRVRVSAGTALSRVRRILSKGLPASVTVEGTARAVGPNKRAHAAPAFEYARKLRQRGISAKVCPAITGSAKCGACRLCSDPGIQVVVYPMH